MKTEIRADSRRAFLSLLVKAPLIPATVLATSDTVAAPKSPERQVLMNAFAIAGFRYYDGPKELPKLTVGTRLNLRAEPDNAHDCFAVEIFHGPAKLGYVPQSCNQHISRLLLEAVPLTCEVERVNSEAPPWEAVAVSVSFTIAGLPACSLQAVTA